MKVSFCGDTRNIPDLNMQSITYPNKDVESISFPKAKEVFSIDDCAGNQVSPDETILYISFKDGSTASLVAKNWYISDLK